MSPTRAWATLQVMGVKVRVHPFALLWRLPGRIIHSADEGCVVISENTLKMYGKSCTAVTRFLRQVGRCDGRRA